MFGLFGKNPKEKPWLKRGGYPKPTRLPGSYKEWQPPVKESPKPEAPAAPTGNPEG